MIKLIHDITQKLYTIKFTDDFQGMIEITYLDYEGKYIRHEHISYPDSSMKELEKAVIELLTFFYNEIKDGGKPKKDALAEGENNG